MMFRYLLAGKCCQIFAGKVLERDRMVLLIVRREESTFAQTYQ